MIFASLLKLFGGGQTPVHLHRNVIFLGEAQGRFPLGHPFHGYPDIDRNHHVVASISRRSVVLAHSTLFMSSAVEASPRAVA
jgi:hypothetical protein